MQDGGGHTLKAFDEDIGRLRGLIVRMGERAETAIGEAMRCLIERDSKGALAVVEGDSEIDALESEAERRVVRLIALRAPMADDLRDVVAALKIAGVVERIGDYAKNIARRVPSIDGNRIEPLSMLPEMARVAATMVHDALAAFAERDPAKARLVCQRDQVVDDYYDAIFRALLTYMMEDPQNITPAAHLLFVARNLERVGDHATNIAEMVHFAATGAHIAERSRGSGT
ncbi:phosphate signaling complex protein PhoU [Allosphingosinicella sp.]|jgi:phosphate transport system protein|uniref:phosphate signaling complex protein PhoU n=1 Tax=Allosphingosinicella sp. TaxID=2823234 RepID=UPI002EEE3F45